MLPRTVEMPEVVCETVKKLLISSEDIVTVMQKIDEAFDRGLHEDPEVFLYSPIKMLPTHLSVVPDGGEVGRFFAIDLGGTKMRFFEIDVVDGSLKSTSLNFEVSPAVMTGTAEQLFNFLADCIREGLEHVGMLDKEIKYFGFTFSFPINQLSLTSGTLIRWTKGYSVDGVVGVDVCALLKESCKKLNLKIGEFVLINDTTGTLLCGAFEDKHAAIGVINGTGTNACYIEDASKARKMKGTTLGHKQVLISTEWGAFGDTHELDWILTDFDKMIDRESLRPGQQLFEKMISAMYIGELVRLILVELVKSGAVFGGNLPQSMSKNYSVQSVVLSLSYQKAAIKAFFKKELGVDLTDDDYDVVAYVCDVVVLRAARLTAAGLSAILRRIDVPRCVIAADGSMFRKHPRFVEYIEETIRSILPEKNFKIILADDGSGKGAALAACVASASLS